MTKKQFSLWSFFKDIPGIKLVHSWMEDGNNVEITVSDKKLLTEMVGFFSSIGRPLSMHLREKAGFTYCLYVSPKEQAWFTPLMKKWLKKREATCST